MLLDYCLPWHRKNKVANNSTIFVEIRNGPNGVLRGPGELIHEKKLKSKISCQAL